MTSTADINSAPSLVLAFDDNGLLPALFGRHDRHLAIIEQALGVTLASRGNRISISGETYAQTTAKSVLDEIYGRLKDGQNIGAAEVEAALRMADLSPTDGSGTKDIVIKTRKREIMARSKGQQRYLDALSRHDLVFALGPAGTGKTYLAVAMAVSRLASGAVDRIILSRPAVEAGEKLGFLPGDLREKVDPYLRPLYDALYDMLPVEQVSRRLDTGDIEIAPLAFMRGRTLSNAYIILDEAQNTTAMQMKMLLTRLGENASMVVTGDLTQVDLPRGERSGLGEAVKVLRGMKGVSFVHFDDTDVVRHPLVARMVRAYQSYEKKGDRNGQPGPTNDEAAS